MIRFAPRYKARSSRPTILRTNFTQTGTLSGEVAFREGRFYGKTNEIRCEGQYYFNARYYDTRVGRFISEDKKKAGVSWYAYCNNNPLKLTDPSGLDPVIKAITYSQVMELYKSAIGDLGRSAGKPPRTLGPSTVAVAQSDGTSVNLNRIDSQNPVRDRLVKQPVAAMADRPNLWNYGCNFRTIGALCEMSAGSALTIDSIKKVWDTAVKQGFMESGGSVSDRTGLSGLFYKELGLPKLRLYLEGGTPPNNGVLIGTRRREDPEHYSAGDDAGNEVWDPSDINRPVTITRKVYVYGAE